MQKIVSLLTGAIMFTLMAGSALALNLYDANGQNLGTFLGQENTAFSNFASGWKSCTFEADGRIWGWYVDYPTSDCTGPAYISVNSGASHQMVFRIEETLYSGKKTTTALIMTACSQKGPDGTCTPNKCSDPDQFGTPEPGKYIPIVDVTEKLPFDYPVVFPLTYK